MVKDKEASQASGSLPDQACSVDRYYCVQLPRRSAVPVVFAFLELPNKLLMSACSLFSRGSGGGSAAGRFSDVPAALGGLPVCGPVCFLAPSSLSLQRLLGFPGAFSATADCTLTLLRSVSSAAESLSSRKKCCSGCLARRVALGELLCTVTPAASAARVALGRSVLCVWGLRGCRRPPPSLAEGSSSERQASLVRSGGQERPLLAELLLA